jgi:hypothetical protein
MKDWYCAFDGKTEGPYSIDDLKEMIEGGRLTLDSLLWNGAPGNAEKGWVKASATELAPFFPLTLSPPMEKPVQKPVWQQAGAGSTRQYQRDVPLMRPYDRYKLVILKFVRPVVWLIVLYIVIRLTRNTPVGEQVSIMLGRAMSAVNALIYRWLGISF